MTLFPETVNKKDAEELTLLACKIFNTTPDNLNKKQILYLIQLDMATIIDELTISVSITRPTEIKYATNNYFSSIKLSLDQIAKINEKQLEELPLDQLLPNYLERKKVLYRYISSKHESAENFLRTLVENAAAKDNCPKTGRLNE